MACMRPIPPGPKQIGVTPVEPARRAEDDGLELAGWEGAVDGADAEDGCSEGETVDLAVDPAAANEPREEATPPADGTTTDDAGDGVTSRPVGEEDGTGLGLECPLAGFLDARSPPVPITAGATEPPAGRAGEEGRLALAASPIAAVSVRKHKSEGPIRRGELASLPPGGNERPPPGTTGGGW